MKTLKEQNRLNQQRHRDKTISQLGINQFKKIKAEEMRLYRAKKKVIKETEAAANPKPIIDTPKKTVVIPIINTNTKSSTMNQYNGLKYKVNKVIDTIPSYITRDTKLSLSSINNYMLKLDMVNRIMIGKPLSVNTKNEILKLLNNRVFDEKILFDEIPYLDDVDKVIHTLRSKYYNDNSFNGYLIAFTVVLSHIPELRSDYLKASTLTKDLTNQIQAKRDDNILEYPDKIIDLSDRKVLLDNIDKLPNITDKLIYGLNVLIPPRRLEYRFVILTDETDTKLLMDTNNYLIIRDKWRFVFNEYKTAKTFEQQVIPIPDDLKLILVDYINVKGLNVGDLLFSLQRDKQKEISQSSFSSLISNVFKKVHGVAISNRFLRYSAASNATNQKLSKKDRQQLAFDMGHSLIQNLSYSKHVK
jgi:hypothetical protein